MRALRRIPAPSGRPTCMYSAATAAAVADQVGVPRPMVRVDTLRDDRTDLVCASSCLGIERKARGTLAACARASLAILSAARGGQVIAVPVAGA